MLKVWKVLVPRMSNMCGCKVKEKKRFDRNWRIFCVAEDIGEVAKPCTYKNCPYKVVDKKEAK